MFFAGGFAETRVVEVGVLTMVERVAELITESERDAVRAVVAGEGVGVTVRQTEALAMPSGAEHQVADTRRERQTEFREILLDGQVHLRPRLHPSARTAIGYAHMTINTHFCVNEVKGESDLIVLTCKTRFSNDFLCNATHFSSHFRVKSAAKVQQIFVCFF